MLPGRSEIIYSCKCFAGALLAVYMAFYIGLPRPFWAFMTAYIVANPMTGAVRSKALFRCGGTLVGSAFTVLMVPQLANAPELLSLALALWVGLCLYISLLDRTSRSYFFMLAGYTAGLIGFPVVADPGNVFNVALARSEEITLGIVCATMVHTLVLPQSLGALLLRRVNQTFDDARSWMRSALRCMPAAATAMPATAAAGADSMATTATTATAATTGVPGAAAVAVPAAPATPAQSADGPQLDTGSAAAMARTDMPAGATAAVAAAQAQVGDGPPVNADIWRRLAADITELRLMASNLPYDTSSLRWMAGTVHALHDRLALLVPLLLSIEDRLRVLGEIDPASLTPAWRRLAAGIENWIADSSLEQGPVDAGRAAGLRAEIEALMPALAPSASWSTILRLNLALRLRSLLDTAEESLGLQRQLDAVLHGRRPDRAMRLAGTSPWHLHLDHGMAFRSALAAVIATLACCMFWIFTGWPSGAAAASLAAVFCCFFASFDDPAPNIQSFLTYTIFSIPLSAIYLLVVEPAVHSFETFAMALAPLFLLIGLFLPRPAYAGRALALIVGVCGTLSLQDTGNSDMASFVNGMLAQIVGVFAAVLSTRLLRSMTARQSARRLIHAGRRELVQISARARAPSLLAMSALMLDRIALLAPRLAGSGAQADPGTLAALTELRIGLNMAQLRHVQRRQAGGTTNQPGQGWWRGKRQHADGNGRQRAQACLQTLMQELHGYFRSAPPADHGQTPQRSALLLSIDAALLAFCSQSAGAEQSLAVAALASLRRDLFPDAPWYAAPASPAAPGAAAAWPAAATSPDTPAQENRP